MANNPEYDKKFIECADYLFATDGRLMSNDLSTEMLHRWMFERIPMPGTEYADLCEHDQVAVLNMMCIFGYINRDRDDALRSIFKNNMEGFIEEYLTWLRHFQQILRLIHFFRVQGHPGVNIDILDAKKLALFLESINEDPICTARNQRIKCVPMRRIPRTGRKAPHQKRRWPGLRRY